MWEVPVGTILALPLASGRSSPSFVVPLVAARRRATCRSVSSSCRESSFNNDDISAMIESLARAVVAAAAVLEEGGRSSPPSDSVVGRRLVCSPPSSSAALINRSNAERPSYIAVSVGAHHEGRLPLTSLPSSGDHSPATIEAPDDRSVVVVVSTPPIIRAVVPVEVFRSNVSRSDFICALIFSTTLSVEDTDRCHFSKSVRPTFSAPDVSSIVAVAWWVWLFLALLLL